MSLRLFLGTESLPSPAVRVRHQTRTDAESARCLFWDAAGITKAHVFAKSWTGLFDEPSDAREHEVVHRYVDPSTGKQREIKRAKTFALVSRKVCGTCNSGWLSQLEERVRPIMAAFARNVPMILNSDEQADVALWATVASLIAMSMDPEAWEFADPTLSQEVYSTKRPTPGMDIWLGANAHGELGWFGSHSLNLRNVSGAPEQGAWGATITFGYAVIHIVCHNVPDQRIRLKGDALRSLRRIWGTRDRVVWPPKLLMRPHDLSPLALIVTEQCSFERAVHRSAPDRRGPGAHRYTG